jgi:hypothetical protein
METLQVTLMIRSIIVGLPSAVIAFRQLRNR